MSEIVEPLTTYSPPVAGASANMPIFGFVCAAASRRFCLRNQVSRAL